MRTDLEDDPTVIFIARVTKLQPDHVVGKLHRLWSWVNSHTADGALPGVDADWIDGYVKKRGFANAMASAPHPWLVIDSDGLTIPNFPTWFGSCAKRRLTDTRRKQSVRSLSANGPKNLRTKTGLQERRVQERRDSSTLDEIGGMQGGNDRHVADIRKIAKIVGPKSDADRGLIVRVAMLIQRPGFPEGAVWDALEGARTAGRGNLVAYWRACLDEKLRARNQSLGRLLATAVPTGELLAVFDEAELPRMMEVEQ